LLVCLVSKRKREKKERKRKLHLKYKNYDLQVELIYNLIFRKLILYNVELL